MITVYAPDTLDWSNNGLCLLYPTSCPITETAGGNYDLEINHPMTDDNRWTMLQKGYLIKTLVPKRDTPLIQQSIEARPEQPEHIIWHVTAAAGGRLYTKASSGYSSWSSSRTYNKGNKVNYQGKSYSWGSEIPGNATPPGGSWKKVTTGSKLIKRLNTGAELLYLKAEDTTWSQVTASDGTPGYMQTSTIAYLRTEPYIAAHPAYNTAVPPRQVRDQLFRIYDVTIDTEQHSVKALARHISYDQVRNFVKTYNPKGVPLQAALFSMSADMINEHDFAYYTNISQEITAEWALKNGVLALLDPEQGAAAKTQAQVVRDNYDIFLLGNVDTDRGVVIESGKNLLGVTSNVNDDNAVTRIMPYGTDADGKMLLLPEVYIDSQFIDNYPNERAVPLQISEAVEKAASGEDPGMTKEQCYEKMRAAVQAEYDKGVDLPDFDIKVTFVQLGDTEEYKAYRAMQQLYLYDLVTVKHGRLGLYYKTQVIGYTYDAALKRYTSMTLGNIKNGADLGAIAGFQLPNAGISGRKLVPGSVGSMHLRELSVLTAHIGLAQIVNAHIQDATIDKAKIRDFVAEVATIAVAKIADAWIDQAWIIQLSAKVVDIVTANVNTLIVTNADIRWGDIANLTAAIATVVSAQIDEASIDAAQITDLSAVVANIVVATIDTAWMEQANIDWAQITNLGAMVANVVTATINTAYLQQADINWAAIQTLTASMVEIVHQAKINWAKIEGVDADSLLFRQGEGGKLFIDNLAVNDANMVSLAVGKLMIAGADGKFFQLQPDGSGGVSLVEAPVGANNLPDSSIPGGKMIEGTITAREINVTMFLGDEALIRAIKSTHIDADEVWGSEAFFGKVTASHLASDVGETLNLESNTAILARVKTEDLEGWARYNGEYIELGQAGSVFLTRLGNTKLAFLVNGLEQASFGYDRMFIQRAEIGLLTVGRPLIYPQHGYVDYEVKDGGIVATWREAVE